MRKELCKTCLYNSELMSPDTDRICDDCKDGSLYQQTEVNFLETENKRLRDGLGELYDRFKTLKGWGNLNSKYYADMQAINKIIKNVEQKHIAGCCDWENYEEPAGNTVLIGRNKTACGETYPNHTYFSTAKYCPNCGRPIRRAIRGAGRKR